VVGTLHLVADDEDGVRTRTSGLNDDLGQILHDKKTTPGVAKLLQGIKITAKGREVVVEGTASETDLASIPLVLAM
jgi:hypothetical protein